MGRESETFLSALRALLGEIISFTGAKGLVAILFILLGALVEGVGLLLLIPFVALIVGAGHAPEALQAVAASLFALFGAETRLQKLALLIVVFVALMLMRGLIITAREVTMTRLALGFMLNIRTRLTRQLAGADWAVVSTLRHGRVLHLMSTDVQQLNTAV